MRTPTTAAARAHGEKGVAMLEFVLMLPFIWIILALTFNFGMAFLEKQRVQVAVREVAIRHAVRIQDKNTPLDAIVREVQGDTLKPAGITAQFQLIPGSGQCDAAVSGADESRVRATFGVLTSLLGKLSASHAYRVTAQGKPVVGRLLPQPRYGRCYAIDVGTWTYQQTGGIGDWIKRLLGNVLGRIAGAILK